MSELTSGSGYELEVEGEACFSKTNVAEFTRHVDLVESIPMLGEDGKHQIKQNRVRMRVVSEPGTEPGSVIASSLYQAGFALHEMRRINATLEDVFLQLTREENTIESQTESEVNVGEAA